MRETKNKQTQTAINSNRSQGQKDETMLLLESSEIFGLRNRFRVDVFHDSEVGRYVARLYDAETPNPNNNGLASLVCEHRARGFKNARGKVIGLCDREVMKIVSSE